MRYIFNNLNYIKKKLAGKYLFLFLDFDGTLTPIVSTPNRVKISQEAKSLLGLLSQKNNCGVAIISGRALPDLKRKLNIKDIIYSGNHGFQIEGSKIKYEFPMPLVYRKALQQIKDQLERELNGLGGVFVEDKKFSLALHYRLVKEKYLNLIKTVFHEAVIMFLIKNKIRIRKGKKVLEVNPPINWDKGKVVLWLLARQQFTLKRGDILPVYIGDDVTDEDAFKVLKSKGLTVFVGKPRNSLANYYLKSPKEVIKFLSLISELKD
jgi:trehalose-phosphatase